MSDHRCPREADLLRFVDGDLPPEQLARVEAHLELCSACAKQVLALSSLVGDIAAALPLERPLELSAHVAGVMQRLDTPIAPRHSGRLLAWCGAVAAAAAALLLLTKLHGPSADEGETRGAFSARGGPAVSSLSREVGVELYTPAESPLPLGRGAVIAAQSAVTAGVRNAGSKRAYLLLFAIDSARAVHWIAPEYTSPGSDPAAFPIEPASAERPLPSAAVFDDLAVGRLRIVALISRTPLHVSDVEALSAADLSGAALRARFAGADVREFPLEARAKAP